MRFRFTHEAGQGYRHYIEATFFGIPVLKINEHYLDGEGVMEIPVAGTFQGPKINQGSLWATLIAEEIVSNAGVAEYIRARGE